MLPTALHGTPDSTRCTTPTVTRPYFAGVRASHVAYARSRWRWSDASDPSGSFQRGSRYSG